MALSLIQWTDYTFNIVWGCTPVDSDCKFCYADRLDARYHKVTHWGMYAKRKLLSDEYWKQPIKWNEKAKKEGIKYKVFTSSMGDIFEDNETVNSQRIRLFELIRKCPHLIFQILTKRPERIEANTPADLLKAKNIWFGTSVGSPNGMQRIYDLLKVDCETRFVSFEPLHKRVDMNLDLLDLMKIHWAIIGGESGNGEIPEQSGVKYGYRECKLEWIEKIVSQCQTNNVPVFVKQLGTHLSKELNLSDRHGGNINEFPKHLQIRQFPIIK